MTLDEFVGNTYGEMEKTLNEIKGEFPDLPRQCLKSSTIILNSISELKNFILRYKFKNIKEEIHFFKNEKPRFYSKLYYYQYLFRIEFHKPIASILTVINYYESEIILMNNYFNRNNEFYLYYKAEAKYLDEIYFVRNIPDSWTLLDFDDYQTDLSFSTVYDHKISKFIAFEALCGFIDKKIKDANVIDSGNKNEDVNNIRWTGSKVSLVELLYAIQSTGSCNNGTIDLKRLANQIEKFFQIDLGNYYRIFQEMRIRKINRTSYLDQLKERLIQRMDEQDENPRFK